VGLPALTHLQYMTLKILAEDGGFIDAATLRKIFLEHGAGNRSLPAFYQFMDRLVEDAYVRTKRQKGESDRVETYYQIRAAGRDAMAASHAFYQS
jgi:DNA-binding PadR family transcriptional regulator